MSETNITVDRIKTQAKLKGITIKSMLENCKMGVNTITNMSNGADIQSKNLLKIADYLDVSADYLLGRIDTTEKTLTEEEKNLIKAYRDKEPMQEAVRKILDI